MTHEHESRWRATGGASGSRRLRVLIAVALLFAGLTAVMTWPLVMRMSTAVGDHGDPLLNSWILAWNAHRLADPLAGPWFDANIFHPHPRTLAWSEHLLPQSLLAAPVICAGGGAVLAHNLLLFVAFATNGLAAFLLGWKRTGNIATGVAAGIVFAFCPFMFGHIWHLQVLCAAGIPLSFLFLERLLDHADWRDALALAAVLTAQALANGYYAVFLSLLVPLFVAVELTTRRVWTSTRLWARLVAAGAIVAALSAPFFAQYLGMRVETGFARAPLAVTTWPSLLAVHPLNRLWGPLTSHLGAGERHLFPGLTVLVLAVIGVLRRRDAREGARAETSMAGYLTVGATALVLSFGSGAYRIVADLLPGFDAIRAVSRLHVFVMLVLALLAAHGAAVLAPGRGLAVRWLLHGSIPILLLVEYATVPIPWAAVYGPADVPPVYRWIDEHAGREDVLLELPIPTGHPDRPYAECKRLYASTFHWRRLVNGYSGFEPPLYTELVRRWASGAPEDNLRDAADLGVRWIVVHADMPRGAELARELDAQADYLRPVATFGDARLYELPPAAMRSEAGQAPVLPRDTLRTGASVNGEHAPLAADGDPRTRWDSGGQRPGTRFEVDLGKTAQVCGVRLRHGPSHFDWPRGLRVEGSLDGDSWVPLAERSPLQPPLVAWLDPGTAAVEVTFSTVPLRRMRLELTERHEDHYWSIHELDVLGPPCAGLP